MNKDLILAPNPRILIGKPPIGNKPPLPIKKPLVQKLPPSTIDTILELENETTVIEESGVNNMQQLIADIDFQLEHAITRTEKEQE